MSAIALSNNNTSPFDQIRHQDAEGVEYWVARELMPLLGYGQWRRFEENIYRAKFACQNSGYRVNDHFADADNVVERPQGGGSRQSDYKLSRYACYLTAMNGDPRKPEIAGAQNYFAVKTYEAELALQSQELLSHLLQRFDQQNQVIEEQGQAIALLQSQVQNLLPISSDFIPPGWDADVWEKLPPQDKRHFRFIYQKYGFRPDGDPEPTSSTRKAEGRGQEAEGILDSALCRDRTEQGFESPTEISDSVALIWWGSESPTKFFPSAFCLLPSASCLLPSVQYPQMQGENKMPNVQKLNSSPEKIQASYGDRSELKVSDNLSSPIQTLNKPIQILNHEQAE